MGGQEKETSIWPEICMFYIKIKKTVAANYENDT